MVMTVEEKREYNKQRHIKRYSVHKEAINLRNKIAKYKNRYNLNYDEVLKIKENGCEICGIKQGKLCIDHNHTTGKIRGCLCTNCNSSLGKLGEDYERIIKLASYLKRHTE